MKSISFYVDEAESEAVRRLAESALTRALLRAGQNRSLRVCSIASGAKAHSRKHLVCARENGLEQLYTNDRHMLLAAPAFRVKALTI